MSLAKRGGSKWNSTNEALGYYEARNAKPNTPVMLWLTGGPGGSSQVSALVENGDCYFDMTSGEPKRNPYGWTEDFHMIYLDQPAGVGFSYVDNNTELPRSTEEAAPDVVWFLKLFSEAFPNIARNPLHVAGESFGGRWAPVFGDLIIKYNELTPLDEQIPLASLVIVSPWTRPGIQLVSTFDVSCFPFKEHSAYINSSACAKMEAAYQHCETVMQACESTNDPLVCKEASRYCMENIEGVVENQLVNKYDRRMTCARPGECYPIMLQVQDWMNSKAVFGDMLDVVNQSGGLKTSFDFMSMRTYADFLDSGDTFMDSSRYVSSILTNSKIPMFFTAGDSDVMVNPKGVRETLERIRWDGRPNFKNSPFEQFPSSSTNGGADSGRAAAVMRRTNRLWYAEVGEAGHMVCFSHTHALLVLSVMK